ncbi:4Fe-4S binding protein [Candidatus Lokiarchaeum ossiferum]|uniref:4Fe-4S binding protein n=1 Tax=Candidatus Lokiarchaeum ossiferum TaxID=2951803 RepID=UPI00352E345C
MKWPIFTTTEKIKTRTFSSEYLTRKTDLILHLDKCKTCKQCVRACPKNALEMPMIAKGTKVPLVARMPLMPDQSKCVFCGVCTALCPFEALSMKLDGQEIPIRQLQLSQKGILPKIARVKIGKVELSDPEFTNAFWNSILLRIQTKK